MKAEAARDGRHATTGPALSVRCSERRPGPKVAPESARPRCRRTPSVPEQENRKVVAGALISSSEKPPIESDRFPGLPPTSDFTWGFCKQTFGERMLRPESERVSLNKVIYGSRELRLCRFRTRAAFRDGSIPLHRRRGE